VLQSLKALPFGEGLGGAAIAPIVSHGENGAPKKQQISRKAAVSR
jgi:hypothetical protein